MIIQMTYLLHLESRQNNPATQSLRVSLTLPKCSMALETQFKQIPISKQAIQIFPQTNLHQNLKSKNIKSLNQVSRPNKPELSLSQQAYLQV